MKLGIIGSGQLGLMMILEGKRLGLKFNVIDASTNGPASRIADRSFTYDQYREFVDDSDFITYEFEHVDERVLNYADKMGKLRPGLFPVELKRDRSGEKLFLKEKKLPVGPFEVAEDAATALRLGQAYENAVIKSTHGGYDGKGQYYVRDGRLSQTLPEGKYVVEEFVRFDFEASIIGARDENGRITFYDPSLNVNRHGMLYYNVAPIEDFGMRDIAGRLMRELGYIGVLGVEFFILNGKAYINEFAPRVHNTGHHTLMGTSVSQFEQHVRAVCGFPLAQPLLYRPSGILNIVGIEPGENQINNILEMEETQYFWYGKNGVRRRRKVGHVNTAGESFDSVKNKIEELSRIVYGENPDDYFLD